MKEVRETLEDVLLPVGTVIQAGILGCEEEDYIIIGKRVLDVCNHRSWDYAAVSLSDGLIVEPDGDDNVIFFNHIEIFCDSFDNGKDKEESED